MAVDYKLYTKKNINRILLLTSVVFHFRSYILFVCYFRMFKLFSEKYRVKKSCNRIPLAHGTTHTIRHTRYGTPHTSHTARNTRCGTRRTGHTARYRRYGTYGTAHRTKHTERHTQYGTHGTAHTARHVLNGAHGTAHSQL